MKVMLPACVSVYHMYAVPVGARRDPGCPETGVTDGCEPRVGCEHPVWVLGTWVLVKSTKSLSVYSCVSF